jgi:hypothetical protein
VIARTRTTNAADTRSTAATPSRGCSGANVLVAPEAPSSATCPGEVGNVDVVVAREINSPAAKRDGTERDRDATSPRE